MSAQAGSAGAIVLGVALILVGALTEELSFGTSTLLIIQGILLIAGGAVGLAFPPQVSSPTTAKSRQLEVATSSEGFPIPVIFGEQKITGNFMQYRKETFKARKVYGEPAGGGGKGGGVETPKNVVGFDYFLQYEYGLCMGPIDSIMQVWSQPGEIAMRPSNPVTEAAFAPGQDYIELTLDAHNEGGLVRVYQGNGTQTRVNPGGSDRYVQDYIDTVTVPTSGINYPAKTKATVTGDGFGGEVNLVIEAGEIKAVKIMNRGYGYTHAAIVLSDYGAGTGATFAINIGLATMNYRNVCWALFGPGSGNFDTFKIGRFPQPKSYAFVIRRLPVVKRDDGTSIANFKVRGSFDATKPGYYQANPAAMMYELMTNKLWGRGLSSSLIDEASFVKASKYFSDRHIGISYTLDGANKITELLDILRSHLRTILVWDGDTLKCRVLMYPAETKLNIPTVTENEVAGLRVSRPDWMNTFNEIRAEFNHAQRNYRPDVIHVIDGANVALVGGRVNPIRINLPAFTDFNIAWKQVQRMLREFTYPLASAEFEMNMFQSQIEVGDTFRLVWREYGTGLQTMYFTCLKKVEAGSKTENVKIVAIEDTDLPPLDDAEYTIDVPDKQAWEDLPDLDVSKIGLFVVPGTVNDAISPVTAFELPAIFTGGVTKTIFLGEPGNDGIVGFVVNFKQQQSSFTFLENYDSFAITGTLITAIDDSDYFNRRPEGAFDFSLTNVERNESTLLGSASLVSLETDSLETLLDSGRCLLFVEDECIQIGKIEKIDANTYRAFNVIRGAIGTRISTHNPGTVFYYVDSMPLQVHDNRLIPSEKLQFQINPLGTAGSTENGTPFYIFHTGDKNQEFIGLGNRPLSPLPVAIGASTDPDFPGLQITLRPRNYHKGAETGPLFNILKDLIPNAETMDFSMQQIDANGDFCIDPRLIPWEVPRQVASGGKVKVVSIADYIEDKTGGTVTFYGVQLEPDCVEVRVFAILGGARSVDYASFYP